jgi:hypothetical protein
MERSDPSVAGEVPGRFSSLTAGFAVSSASIGRSVKEVVGRIGRSKTSPE